MAPVLDHAHARDFDIAHHARVAETPEQTRDVARIIQENATASLTELRSVLNTLRGGQMDGLMPQAPQRAA